eukprot:Nitzschia sp. Nitz4//scaffold1_size375055//88848//89302//NITZ4_000235-RA/size375055-augustus-gene-0.665-mRNA-1//1//CDS//3329540922//6685//frame0
MSTIKLCIGRFAARSNCYSLVPRALFATNSSSAPVQRLHDALEDYRLANYGGETPHRFEVEMWQPYLSPKDHASVEVSQLNRMLDNIGQAQKRLTEEEQDILLRAAGCSGTSIPVNKLTSLLIE